MKPAALVAAALCLPSACLAQPIVGTDGRLYSRRQVQVFLDHCSLEADARGLNVGQGYGAERFPTRMYAPARD